jgi:hypothetical protein
LNSGLALFSVSSSSLWSWHCLLLIEPAHIIDSPRQDGNFPLLLNFIVPILLLTGFWWWILSLLLGLGCTDSPEIGFLDQAEADMRTVVFRQCFTHYRLCELEEVRTMGLHFLSFYHMWFHKTLHTLE